MDRVLIIAEIGVNHNGDPDTARRLVDVAKEAGADIAKFQTFNPAALVANRACMAEYQKQNMGVSRSQKEMLEDLMLPFEEFERLAEYCRNVGIGFLSTPFDIDSIEALNPLLDTWKIPSGEITNYPYLLKIAQTHKDIILSTGMCTIEEVHEAVDVLTNNGSGSITLLHCTTDYPAAMEEVNLNAMLNLRDTFGLPVGYSDHTPGIEVSIAATAMGAKVIEKHFTLDRNMPGPDHRASLEPDELKRLVKCVRNVEKAMGNYEKKPSEAELKNRIVARKSITAARTIKAGELLTPENITTKRPGDGISPMKWNEVIGTKAIRDFDEDDPIEV